MSGASSSACSNQGLSSLSSRTGPAYDAPHADLHPAYDPHPRGCPDDQEQPGPDPGGQPRGRAARREGHCSVGHARPLDFVNVAEAPDVDTIWRVSMELGSRGTGRYETLTAIPVDD